MFNNKWQWLLWNSRISNLLSELGPDCPVQFSNVPFVEMNIGGILCSLSISNLLYYLIFQNRVFITKWALHGLSGLSHWRSQELYKYQRLPIFHSGYFSKPYKTIRKIWPWKHFLHNLALLVSKSKNVLNFFLPSRKQQGIGEVSKKYDGIFLVGWVGRSPMTHYEPEWDTFTSKGGSRGWWHTLEPS